MYERLELYIETLTGTAFELRVSPFETIQDIKARIQKLEGIPVSQQHLVWQSVELDDDRCLSDYSITDGATLKLVLTLRGGPINTRRIPMEDPSVREMAEYLSESAAKEELLDKAAAAAASSQRPVTVIVYHNGEQFNFFRVVDRENTSPLSESLSGASVYNLYGEEEDDEESALSPGGGADPALSPSATAGADKRDENAKMRDKMRLIRMKMENLNVNKKNVKKKTPHPPSSGRPVSRTRLRRLPSHSGAHSAHKSLNRNRRLPPVGQTTTSDEDTNLQAARQLFHSATANAEKPASPELRRLESVERPQNLTSVREDSPPHSSPDCDKTVGGPPHPPSGPPPALSKEAVLRRAHSSLRAANKYDFSPELLLKDSPSAASSGKPLLSSRVESRSDGLERLLEAASSGTDVKAPQDAPPPRRVRHSMERLHSGGVVLETLHPSEVRAMSGVLNSLVRSASKPHSGGYTLSTAPSGSNTNTLYRDCTRIPTPEGRLMSARLQRMSSGRDISSPTHRLPPVKPKKKSKRCFLCGKKTGLANSYPCRCSHNFCTTHRYPEAHGCTFDYKTEGRKILEQNNPVVSAPKLPKI